MKRKYKNVAKRDNDYAKRITRLKKRDMDVAKVYGELVFDVLILSLNQQYRFGIKRIEELRQTYFELMCDFLGNTEADPLYAYKKVEQAIEKIGLKCPLSQPSEKSPSRTAIRKGTNKKHTIRL